MPDPEEPLTPQESAAYDQDFSDKAAIDAIARLATDAYLAGQKWGLANPGKKPIDAASQVGGALKPLTSVALTRLQTAIGLQEGLEIGIALRQAADAAGLTDEQSEWAMEVVASRYVFLKAQQRMLPLTELLNLSGVNISAVSVVGDGGGAQALRTLLEGLGNEARALTPAEMTSLLADLMDGTSEPCEQCGLPHGVR